MCARNAQALAAAAERIRKQYSVEVFHQALDVTDAHAVHEFVEAVVAKFGAADICVTNAGGPPAKGFLATTVDDWRKAVDANFMSTVYFAREVIPHMQRKRWGRIITITSITTKQPVADLVLSNAVRAAVVGLVKSLANEFGKDGILVNNVGPGLPQPTGSRNWPRAVRLLRAERKKRSSMAGRRMRHCDGWESQGKWPTRSCGWLQSARRTLPDRQCLSMAVSIKGCNKKNCNKCFNRV